MGKAIVFKNQSGFTALQAIAGAGIMAVVVLGGLEMANQAGNTIEHASASASARATRELLLANIRSSDAWKNTIKNNPSMACLDLDVKESDRPECNPGIQAQAFKLYDNTGAIIYSGDPAQPKQRFKSDGSACSIAVGKDVANDECPFQVDLQWKAICKSGVNCKRPQVQVSAVFSYLPDKTKSRIVINTKNYDFNFLRGAEGFSAASVCRMMGGIYDANKIPDCQICPNPDEFAFYVGNPPTKQCRRILDLCPVGQVVVADNVSGHKCVDPVSLVNSSTNTISSTNIQTNTQTATITVTNTDSQTITDTQTLTISVTDTSTNSATNTITLSSTVTATSTQTNTVIIPPVIPVTVNCAAMQGENIEGGCKFHTPGSYRFIVPPGLTNMTVTAIGAGGGASSRDNDKWSGAHGGGGGAAIKSFSVNAGQSFDLSVGHGGTSAWWGRDGTVGENSSFTHPAGTIIGKGGGIGKYVRKSGWVADPVAQGGTGEGGDINCAGGNGSFCMNKNFRCKASDAPLCNGKSGGLSLLGTDKITNGDYGGGGGASEYGGNGVILQSDYAGCGGGGGDIRYNGANGCVIIKWQ